MKLRVRRLGLLEPGDRGWSQSQTFTSGKTQTGDDDDHDDLAPETRPGFVFTGCHRMAVRADTERRSYRSQLES